MRLSTQLLLGYVLVLTLVGGALAVAVPNIAERAMLRGSAQLLARQADRVAQQLARDGATALPSAAYTLGATYLVVDTNAVVRAAPRLSSLAELVGSPLPAELAQMARRTLTQGTATDILPFRNTTVVAGAAPIRIRERPAGAIILLQPAQDLDPAIRRLTRTLLVWTLVGLAAAVLLAGIVGRRLVRRLSQVQVAAAALAEGDLARRVPEEGTDELTDLARSFNHMAGRLEHLVSSLRTSEEMRRETMAAIAHELRTPVTSIRGFAEALRDGVVPPEKQGHYFGIIAGESARLSRLIQDLFDLAKLEAGQMEFRMQPLDAVAWFHQFAEGVRPRVEGAGLHLVVEARVPRRDEAASSRAGQGGSMVLISADRDRLDQVLHNLLENALRFSPPHGSIRLILIPHPAAGEVEVAVADQGPGIPPEEQERIWDRFYQSKERGEKKGGAGLGLAIVRSIVQAHGGRVGVTSPPGQGARFWFALPLRERGPEV